MTETKIKTLHKPYNSKMYIPVKLVLLTFGGEAELSIILFLNNPKLALPYICLLIVLSVFTKPSTESLLHGELIAFSMDVYSESKFYCKMIDFFNLRIYASTDPIF